MSKFLVENYDWLRAFHIISVISWMAGMFYMPRLFVYHARVEVGSQSSEIFKEMERKLLRIIINPAMIATWIFGLSMVFSHNLWGETWFLVKFFCVILMSGFHGYLARWRRFFAADKNIHNEKFYRMINEIPPILMIIIVILVIIKPF